MTANKVTESGMIKPTLTEEFLLARRRMGLTQADAAKKLDVPLRTLRAWEQGENKPGRFAAKALRAFIDSKLQ